MENDVIKTIKDLILIPSFGGVNIGHPIIQYLESAFSTCREIVKLQDEMGNCHMLIGVNTDLKNINNAFLFSGHIDTVTQSYGHTSSLSEEGDNIIGLGSADMKGFISSLISNVENFKKINKPIIISLTSDEETDFYGIDTIISEMQKRNIIPKAVIVGEPTSSKIAYSHRGNSIFIGKVVGKSCHSSTPELGINAINLSMEAISSIEKCINRYKDEASICITKIEGGKACNIVPDLCTTTISARTGSIKHLNLIYSDLQEIYSQIGTKAVESNITNVFNIPPLENTKNSIFRYMFLNDDVTNFTGASEAGFIQQAFNGADIIIYGPGDPRCIHKSGEKIDKNELLQYSRLLPTVITNYISIQKEQDNIYGM